MTIKELKAIIENFVDDAVVLVRENDINEVGVVSFEFHSDGRRHLILEASE